MAQSTDSPLAEYLFKLCLLESVKCKVRNDPHGLAWLEALMSKMINRWDELSKK
jgi:hypothetical protein